MSEELREYTPLELLALLGVDELILDKPVEDVSLSNDIDTKSEISDKSRKSVSKAEKLKRSDIKSDNRDIDLKTESKKFEDEYNIEKTKRELMDGTNEQKSTMIDKEMVVADWQKAKTLEELDTKINKCLSCQLGQTRNRFVFGTGNPDARILFIGEAPGADEDRKGEPFVGRAGQLLTKIIEAMGFKREDLFIANIIKCRPPGNRRPEKQEVAECLPYLKKQLELIKPDFIVALGLTAVDSLFGEKHKMKDIRGQYLDFEGIPVLATYHPAALLRNPAWKRVVWEDMKNLLDKYNEKFPEDAKTVA
ncbi:MAG: hypothetical protein Kapaf2KO_19340 [Candidatus Kapaibacteriales bacterium]